MAESTLENNELIAEFMGWKTHSKYGHKYLQNLSKSRVLPPYYTNINWEGSLHDFNYNESWDWLMPVVDKIRLMDRRVTIEAGYYVNHPTNRVEIHNFRTFPQKPKIVVFYRDDEGSLIDATYEAVIQFIKWYNIK